MWQCIVTFTIFISCTILSLSISFADGFFERRYRTLNINQNVDPQLANKYEIKWFEVPVDHFSYANSDTFKIRYFINDEYWSPETGAPIFFYTGNEGDIELFAKNTGFIWETAPEFKALIVYAEHRYYGQSVPYGNQSFSDKKHWGYLTAEQAMADFVDLIAFLRSDQGSTRSPVIAFGGSYGGMLAVWIRMKYPDSVAGSLAASAPIFMFSGVVDCNAFTSATTSAYRSAEPHCPSNIRQLWRELHKITETEEGRKWISTNWSLCSELKNEMDVHTLKWWIDVWIINVAMVNYPYPASFLANLPAYPVKVFCKHLATENLQGKQLLLQTYEGLKSWFNHTGVAKCLNSSTNRIISLDMTGWNIQVCTEMFLPICSDGVNDMFEPSSWNLNTEIERCEDCFHIKSRPNFIKEQYGGRHIGTASNIIFSNGLLDPWIKGGVLKNVSESTYAVIIPEGAHHLDLRSSNPADPESVIKARNFYKKIFRKWIEEYSYT